MEVNRNKSDSFLRLAKESKGTSFLSLSPFLRKEYRGLALPAARRLSNLSFSLY